MADDFESYHVPQQSRRDRLRIFVQDHPSCEEAEATLHGCAGLIPLYDPSLLSSDMLTCAHAGLNPLGGASEACKQNPASAVKAEGVNLMGYVGGFMNGPSSSSHHSYLDPQSSLAVNPFLLSGQNLRDFDQSFNGGELVAYKPETLSLTRDLTSTGQGLSLSLSSHHTHQHNLPLELNLQRYESAMLNEKGIAGYAVPAIVDSGCSTSNDILRSSVPLGPFTGYASILKGSTFLKPAQQLLEGVCGVGQGIYTERSCGDSSLMDPPIESLSGTGIMDDPRTLGDRGEHRRKKTRLISMLDEVYRRYKQYYQQMQAVVSSFESVVGLANAAPYTSFAIKAMSKHFKCLKNAITDQLQFTSKALGEVSFVRDETLMFGSTDRGLHCQRPVHNQGFLEHQPVWRPQRGLPERAVAVLRSWLFEHFLHPYPTDTDKQMLAKQTGLSRSQVSNWFINARVRLWKPMVEEIHTLETRQAQKGSQGDDRNTNKQSDHLPSANPLTLDNQFTDTQKTQDLSSKRSRNEHPHLPDRGDEPINFSYSNITSHQNVGVGVSTAVGSSGVSLTLGLRQNNGIALSEPFPMNIAHRFGLDANSEAYVMGGFEAQNRHFGKDMGGELLHDFVG
ncbi:hypothetical protein HHK36_016303 [Tetracentron sinense]|uniref:Homeobox domain-containing protein n=1 Tax=Tetracentron sinense TaxID=13715 RepID=A0A834Z0I7_TETSI|nr:hypothetical protein HHK36_016303 [Tetracentron sinense]